MSTNNKSAIYNQAVELAQSGNNEKAFGLFQEYLRANPGDAEAWNDAGAVLFCLGKTEQASEFVEKALRMDPNRADAYWNLTEIYLTLGNGNQAMSLIADMERLGILNVDILNRIAKIFVDNNDKARAVEALLKSLEVSPDQEILYPMLDVIRSKRPKVAFFNGLPGDMKFLKDVYKFCKDRFQVKMFDGTTIDQVKSMMEWADIAWFEWCTDLAAEASKLDVNCKKIVRLHRFEAYLSWPEKVNWQNIDSLVLIGNSYVKDALFKRVPNITEQTNVVDIPNGVNLDRFNFVSRPKGKNIACVGYLNMRKNPMLLLQCMQKLHYIDPQYHLYFAGNFQDEMMEQYVKYMARQLKISSIVHFDGWQDDINGWLEDKHYIVSGSIGESQGMGILEGMACGLKPVIHNFPGADQIFPTEYIFNIAEDFCKQVTSNDYQPQQYRDFVERCYPQGRQFKKINEIMARFEREIDSVNSRNVDPSLQPAQAGQYKPAGNNFSLNQNIANNNAVPAKPVQSMAVNPPVQQMPTQSQNVDNTPAQNSGPMDAFQFSWQQSGNTSQPAQQNIPTVQQGPVRQKAASAKKIPILQSRPTEGVRQNNGEQHTAMQFTGNKDIKFDNSQNNNISLQDFAKTVNQQNSQNNFNQNNEKESQVGPFALGRT